MPVITGTKPYPWDSENPKVGGFIEFRVYCMDCKQYFDDQIRWEDSRRHTFQLVAERQGDILGITLYCTNHDGSTRRRWHEQYVIKNLNWRKVECASSV